MSDLESVVEVTRGAVLESRHRVHVAVVDAEGALRASSGDPDMVTFWRSAAKPLQALPVVEDGAFDRFGITPRELAVICGSHSGTAAHVKTVEGLLEKLGLTADALACGPHDPFDSETRRTLEEDGMEPGRLHNNCSGKHAGMMAVARARGWETDGYHRVEHPVQARLLTEIARWVRMPSEAIGLGVDGCGVVCYALPLRQMAQAYASLASAARAGERGPATVVDAMGAHPDMVAGEGRICTAISRVTEGRLFAKVGAEGVYCVGSPGAELGIAIKVEDGSTRAVAPAIAGVLREMDLISEDDFGALHRHVFREISNTRGEVTGEVRPSIHLRAADA
ncbi:asparaginase [Longimicrobium terrae]|uniref:L-asparaginase II n=1 Tax=Longimicrobium terrae TaxID=1639882 RepID=A0A841H4R1_9BACT|nr:asparaginase [Longimicrobium terrae]MBB4638771.1 L-asparaginase II [Longimicrobium terrae]MBB6073010.1 L-asparaginase II [Longimicrobium terrae]NNC33134.1 asparaginase [Longimicrobium terrae]